MSLSEHQLEEKFIKHLVGMGYERVYFKSHDELEVNFKKQIESLNRTTYSDEFFDVVKRRFYKNGGNIFELSRDLREGISFNENGKDIFVNFLDKNWKRNVFQVVSQVEMEGRRKNRYDVTVLINGMPLVQIELKKNGESYREAFNQINRYKIESYSGLFNLIQLFVVSDEHNTRYFSNTEVVNLNGISTKRLDQRFMFKWLNDENEIIGNLFDFSNDFFEPSYLSKIINEYMVLHTSDKKLMVLRPYQMFSIERALKKVKRGLGGFVWHATGSGKTLTSFKMSQLFSQLPYIDTVYFLVDRRDLYKQTKDEFNNFKEDSVDDTDNTNALVSQIKNNNKLIITTIQKLNNALKRTSRYGEVMNNQKNKRVLFVVDECHRSNFVSGGEIGNKSMHKRIKEHYGNKSIFIGFTGTPLFGDEDPKSLESQRATVNVFGDLIHSYKTHHAIRDGNVLQFKLSLVGNHYDLKDREKKDKKRLEAVSKEVVNLYSKKTENGKFNAILATSSIQEAFEHYLNIRKMNPNLKVASIFSWEPNKEKDETDVLDRDKLDDYIIKDFNRIFSENQTTDDFKKYNDSVAHKMRKKEIDLLIVVNMFLTGFDSKVLNTLFLDKKLDKHNLIQAISRTNRIDGMQNKEFGNIISFQTPKVNFDEALAIYAGDGKGAMITDDDYNDYLKDLVSKISILKGLFPNYDEINEGMGKKRIKVFIKTFQKVQYDLKRIGFFDQFEWNEIKEYLSKEEHAIYLSKYKNLYEYAKSEDSDDLMEGFDYSLIKEEIIDVDYILRLIKDVFKGQNSNERKLLKEKVKKLIKGEGELVEKMITDFIIFLEKNEIEYNIDETFATFKNNFIETKLIEMSENNNVSIDHLKKMIEGYGFNRISIMAEIMLKRKDLGKANQIYIKLLSDIEKIRKLFIG